MLVMKSQDLPFGGSMDNDRKRLDAKKDLLDMRIKKVTH
jgi:hypothetical protein